jgi:hypothetical protein
MFLALGLGAYEVAIHVHVLQSFIVLRFRSVIHALHGEQDMQNGWIESNDNHIYYPLISSLAISGIPFRFSRKTKS